MTQCRAVALREQVAKITVFYHVKQRLVNMSDSGVINVPNLFVAFTRLVKTWFRKRTECAVESPDPIRPTKRILTNVPFKNAPTNSKSPAQLHVVCPYIGKSAFPYLR